MESIRNDRRRFLKSSVDHGRGGRVGMGAARARGARAGAGPGARAAASPLRRHRPEPRAHQQPGRCRRSRAAASWSSFYAKEADLAERVRRSATRRRSSRAASGRSSRTRRSSWCVSASIPNERAPLGIEVMRHGKDFMVDKPGMTTLEQLAEVRRVQAETKRIYSVMYSERHENKATVKAGELVKAGAIGTVIQTVGLGPHRMNAEDAARPGSSSASATAASSATSPRTSSTSSCSSPARRAPRSWRHRSATCTIPSTRASRTSAT